MTAKDKAVHEQGLVSVLRQLHDELDAAVCDAYGWPVTLTDEEILARLVALNAERAAEEAQGHIRWLRPEYQAPDHASRITQHALIQEDSPVYEAPSKQVPSSPGPPAWPSRPRPSAPRWPRWPDRRAQPKSPPLSRGAAGRVAELLETLVTLGQARSDADERFVS